MVTLGKKIINKDQESMIGNGNKDEDGMVVMFSSIVGFYSSMRSKVMWTTSFSG